MRELIETSSEKTGLFVANRRSYGSDLYIRCYPQGVSPKQIFTQELGSGLIELLEPEGDDGDEASRGHEGFNQPVIAGGEPPEVFQSTECAFNDVSAFVRVGVKRERLFAV
jgi:hypothetical protein